MTLDRTRWKACAALRGAVLALLIGMAPCAASAAPFDHGAWDGLVRRHVDADGHVAYRNLRDSDRAALDGYLDALANADPTALGEKERLAFWINAYNAMAVAGIVAGYHAETTFGRYRFFKGYKRRIAGEERTLDEIEHAIIRPEFNDFRAHFAVVCASTSCPVLRTEAYVGERLEAQLNEQARRFLADPSRNRFEASKGAVELSMIFKWFAEDFTTEGRTLAQTLAPYVSDAQRELLTALPVRYMEYDWTMNAQAGQRP